MGILGGRWILLRVAPPTKLMFRSHATPMYTKVSSEEPILGPRRIRETPSPIRSSSLSLNYKKLGPIYRVEMRVSLLFFLLGVTLIIMGYGNQVSKNRCEETPVVKYVPRHVYDELMLESNVSTR